MAGHIWVLNVQGKTKNNITLLQNKQGACL